MPQSALPVLEFQEKDVGRAVRFHRDSSQNTFQITLGEIPGRVHNTWANAANESLAFTVQDAKGRAVSPAWASKGARRGTAGSRRWVSYELNLGVTAARLGHFKLGSVREEREIDAELLKTPLSAPRRPKLHKTAPYRELLRLLEALPRAERDEHLSLLQATPARLRARMDPVLLPPRNSGGAWKAAVLRTSIDGKRTLALEISVDARKASAALDGGHIVLRSAAKRPLRLKVTAATNAPALRPLPLREIFTRDFLRHAAKRNDKALDRDLRAAGLLFTEEKLLAGLKNFGTYFGRDTLMSALMMEDILGARMMERILAGVLRRLSPEGRVSHEETLGERAVLENVAECAALLRARRPSTAKTRRLLADLHKPREFYGMIDDDFILPVLIARYLRRTDVSPARKKSFLRGEVRRSVLANLRFIVARARPYARRPGTARLIGFPPGGKRGGVHPGRGAAGRGLGKGAAARYGVEGGAPPYSRPSAKTLAARYWSARSWRDSSFGYAGGRYPMDVNAIWVPAALEAAGDIQRALGANVVGAGELERFAAAWRGAAARFRVELDASQVRRKITARLSAMPPAERACWRRKFPSGSVDRLLTASGGGTSSHKGSVDFEALALDGRGRPVAVLHTDPSLRLLLTDLSARATAALLRPLLSPYPAGLFVESVGVLVANDAYAPRSVWKRFLADTYHSPKVVWGREMNILLLGLSRQLRRRRSRGLAAALRRVRAAAEASGLRHNELWSYRVAGGAPGPARYPGTCDIQLWSLAAMAADYAARRAGGRPSS